ncbi:hypothetical protein FB451DRAFT_1367399 [Mycena latifolia]|nr:hypothetical protein FB451DRAFT_1367399 [Mycena latifolia]
MPEIPKQLLKVLDSLHLGEQYAETDRPNKHTDRVAWNNHFEREIHLKYDSYSYPARLFEDRRGIKLILEVQDVADLNQTIASLVKELMNVEGCLIDLALENLVLGSFEAEWMALDGKKKREVVLEGLYRGACTAPRDSSRILCPEMTIDSLMGDGEYNLINLLKRIIEHHSSFPGNGRVTGLYLFPHPYVEHEARYSEGATDALKGFVYHCVLLRNFYIVDTLVGILEAFKGHPARLITPTIFLNPKTVRTEGRTKTKQEFRAWCKTDDKVDQSQYKEESAVAYACYSCHKRTKERTDLRRCARCQRVWYCSTHCQKADWKTHKKFCAQQQFDPALLVPAPESPAEFIGCPKAEPGFVRTRALWRQIGCLSKADSQTQEYHFNITLGHTRSVAISHPASRVVFLVARRRAMASGSIPAIHMMFKIVKHEVESGSLNLTVDQVRQQFELEYDIKITPAAIQAAAPFAPPTLQEQMEEQYYIVQREASIPYC